jgi:hypothetical protein
MDHGRGVQKIFESQLEGRIKKGKTKTEIIGR